MMFELRGSRAKRQEISNRSQEGSEAQTPDPPPRYRDTLADRPVGSLPCRLTVRARIVRRDCLAIVCRAIGQDLGDLT